MESAIKTSQPEGRNTLPTDDRSQANNFILRRRQLDVSRLEFSRDVIASVDTASKESWREIINALVDGGFTASELETELAASANTIYKWRNGLAAPREMTRRLLRKAIIDMVEDRLGAM